MEKLLLLLHNCLHCCKFVIVVVKLWAESKKRTLTGNERSQRPELLERNIFLVMEKAGCTLRPKLLDFTVLGHCTPVERLALFECKWTRLLRAFSEVNLAKTCCE